MNFSVDISEKSGVRYLHFGSSWVQGAMRIRQPWQLELEYTREMMLPLLLKDRAYWPKRVLLIGLGAGSLLKFLYRHCPEAHLTVVEIAPTVVSVARQYFHLPDDDKRIHLVLGDGAEYMLAGGKSFDLILVDGFDPLGNAGVLDTVPFYSACAARLAEGGVAVFNLLGKAKGFDLSIGRIKQAVPVLRVLPSCVSGNVIALAANEPLLALDDAAELKAAANSLQQQTGLNLSGAIGRLFAPAD